MLCETKSFALGVAQTTGRFTAVIRHNYCKNLWESGKSMTQRQIGLTEQINSGNETLTCCAKVLGN